MTKPQEFTIQVQSEVPKKKPEGANDLAEQDIRVPGTIENLRRLAKQCAKSFLDHKAEPDAVDLLEELEIIHKITRLVDENTYEHVCQYMIRYVFYFIYLLRNLLFIRCVNLLPPPDDVLFLHTAHAIYVQYHKFTEALSLAICLGDPLNKDHGMCFNSITSKWL